MEFRYKGQRIAGGPGGSSSDLSQGTTFIIDLGSSDLPQQNTELTVYPDEFIGLNPVVSDKTHNALFRYNGTLYFGSFKITEVTEESIKVTFTEDPTPGGIDFTIDDDLTMTDDNVLGLAVPTKPVTQAEYESMTEEDKANKLIIVDEPQWVPVQVYIQEYDTEDGWHVRKWSDGYVEMSNTSEVLIVSTGSGGLLSWSLVNDASDYSLVLPVKLKKKLHEVANIYSEENQVYGYVALVCTRATRGDLDPDHVNNTETYLIQCTPGVSLTTNLNIFVTGRWK